MSVARGNGKSTVVAGISAAVVDPRAAPRGLLLRSVVRAATGHLREDRYELQPGAFTPYQVLAEDFAPRTSPSTQASKSNTSDEQVFCVNRRIPSGRRTQ